MAPKKNQQLVKANTPVGNVSSTLAVYDSSAVKVDAKGNTTKKPKPGAKETTEPPPEDKPKTPAKVFSPPTFDSAPEKRYDNKFGIISLRNLPRLPQDQHLADVINTLQRYLTDTEVEKLFIGYLDRLVSRAELPYNPYPGFVKRIRQHSEGRVNHLKPRKDIVSLFNQLYEPTRIDYLYKGRYCDFLWGLPSILSSCDRNTLKQYEWLVKDMVPRPETMRTRNPGFSIQPIVSMVGAAAFHGTFFDQIPIIQLRVEYYIVGPEEKESIDIFINAMVSDLLYTKRKTPHILLGVTVPMDPTSESLDAETKFWPSAEIDARLNDFADEILDVCLNRKSITAELVMKTDLYMGVYRRGQKLYSFNFRRQTQGAKEIDAGISAYTEMVQVAMHEGVFVERSHAEAYITMFTPRLELIDKDKIHHYQRVTAKEQRHRLMDRFKTRDPDSNALVGSSSASQEGSETSRQRDDRVRVDGFQLQVPRRFAPDSNFVIDPIRSIWQRRVAQCHPVKDVFKAMPWIVQLVLLDRNDYEDELLVQCYKLLRSSASRTWLLMRQNRFIRDRVIYLTELWGR